MRKTSVRITSDYLTPPNWDDTRTIYRNLSKELHVLTDAYKIEIDARTKLMMDHLILAIDEVDQAVDELPTEAERNSITQTMLDYLKNEDEKLVHKHVPESLSIKMATLKKIVTEQNVTDRFHIAVSNIFAYTEKKRHTKIESKLLELVMLEGAATAELPLSIMKIESNHMFSTFFNNLCKLMGIADLIIDARSDYKSNFISIKPTLNLYFKLNWTLVRDGIKLIWNFPERIHFLVYCIKFSMILLFAKD